MPNWVKSKLTFEGNKSTINDLFEKIKTDDSSQNEVRGGNGEVMHIDFNKIIPMPDSLRETPSSSQVDLGIAIIMYKKDGKDDELKKYLSYPWVIKEGVKTINEFIDLAESKKMFNIEDCKRSLDNLEKYGHKDWYSWSIENWGTKWNSSDTLSYENVIEFYTAWTLPEPVIFELSKMVPDVKIFVEFADEDIGNNCGKFKIENGKVSNYNTIDGIEACNIWGYDPADFFPDVLRDRKIDELLDNEKKDSNNF